MSPDFKALPANKIKLISGRYFLILSLILSFSSNKLYATHAMGMDLTYQRVGVDSFMVTAAFYRDCAGVAAPNSISVRVRSVSCNRDFNVTLPRIGSGQETTPVCTNLVTKCNGGSFPGSEEYLYRARVVLPAKCTDWSISTFVCCRNNAITTINNPGSQNIYVEAKINNFYSNSSPSFSNPPVPFVCANQTYCFNNGAVDTDGDSLVYTLVTPRTGINNGDTVTFKAGFSKTKPLSSTPALSLNPITGDLCMFPTDSTQIAVLSILVREFRNGVLISSIMRDIQLRIIGCPGGNNLPTASGVNNTSNYTVKACANSTTTFTVHSVDLDSSQNLKMEWNQSITGATFTISGGSRPVGTFSWTPTLAQVRSQPYCFTVTVTDNNCPFNGSQTFSYCIYVVGVAAVLDSLFDPVCADSCNGRASVKVINGIPPFSYLWNDPSAQLTETATGLCAGTYTVVGVDSTGCTTSTNVVLTDPNPITLTLGSTPASCFGNNDGKAFVISVTDGSPPYKYQWDLATGAQITDTAFNLTAGPYSVTISDNNECYATDTVIVGEPADLIVNMINVSNVSCNGLNDGKAFAQVSGGTLNYTYQWSASASSQTTDSALNLLAGNHSVIISDANGCVTSGNVLITEPGSAITLTLTKVDLLCSGDSSGSATVTPSGGTPPYSYQWDAGTGSQTTQTAVNLPGGTYSVIVRDTNNCTAMPNIIINEPLTPLTALPIDSFVQCKGFTNGVAGVTPTGGTFPYFYQWNAGAGSQTTQYASGLSAGNYTVIVSDSNACADTVAVQILEALTPLVFTANIVNVNCNNGSDGKAFVTVSGGQPTYTIQWDTATGSQTGDTASGLQAGTYQVQITDAFGCQGDTTLIVSEPPPLLTLLTNSSDVSCFGGSDGKASVVVTGGTPPYLYQWSANTGGQTNDTATGLPAGTYSVTVYDSNYCITSPGMAIVEPSTPMNATVSAVNVNCFGGNDGIAIAAGIGGRSPYTYQWDAAAASQTGDTAFNLTAQSYSVTITDSSGCIFDTSVSVSQPLAPLLITFTSKAVLCFGGDDGEAYMSASGGTPPYSTLWDAGAGSQINDTALFLSAGYHSVTLTDDNGCTITDSVLVDGPPEPVVILTSKFNVSCFGGNDGMAIAEANGGILPYVYSWSGPSGNQVNDTAFNLTAGVYTITAYDSAGCDTSVQVLITQPSLLQDSLVVTSNFNGSAIKCFGDSNGSATAFGLGGTAPYSFLWDTSAASQTTATAVNLEEGVYTVIITDSLGCITQGNISIPSPQRMGFNIGLQKNASCNGESDGMLGVAGYGGTSPYRYSWNTTPPVLDSILDSIPVGSYTVTLTDTNGCTHDTTLAVTEPAVLSITSLTKVDARCFNEASGSATVAVTGGTTPYSYFWEISPGIFQLTATAVNLPDGTYPLRIKDKNDCEVFDTVIINEPTLVTVSTSKNDTVCANNPVTLSALGSGGDSSFYNYIWLPPRPDSLPDQNVNPTVTTNYTVRAMDAKGCLSLPSLITIFVRTMVNDTIDVVKDGDICEGDSTFVLSIHNGPFGNYSYAWSMPGAVGFGPHQVKPDTATYYVFSAGDICGNTISDSVLVNVFPNPESSLDSILAMGCEPLRVQFDDTANTLANLTYQWEFGDGNGSTQKNPVYVFNEPGTYNVVLKVTTSNSCSASNASNPSLVIVYPAPDAGFTANPLSADMREPVITFTNATKGAVTYRWYFGDGDSSQTLSPKHTYADTGDYQVILISTSDMGCMDTAVIDIEIKSFYYIDIPNAFTPSSSSSGGDWRSDPDGNMVFFPYTTHPEAVTAYEMIIFNRWGELIFESNSIYSGWDGTYRGKVSPQEVYVYKLNLTFENGQSFEKMGDVTLFR